jgi:ubiquinone/menaquinone biosynthesis C-methylase UbiE
MKEPQSKFGFAGMSLMFKIRDIIRPRKNILKEADLKPGFHVLDFGCGPGGYIRPLARIIGPSGKIYALDMNPQAIESVKALAAKSKLANVETILSDGLTGLPDGSIDAVLLYDVFHHLSRPNDVLAEFRRILKAGGTLSVSDHHLTGEDITSGVTAGGYFRLSKQGEKVHNFTRVQQGEEA